MGFHGQAAWHVSISVVGKSDWGEFKQLHRQQPGRDEAGFIKEKLAISGLLRI